MKSPVYQSIKKYLAVCTFAALFLGVLPSPVYAVIYEPGVTLDPACLPTDINCTVKSAATKSDTKVDDTITIAATTTPATPTNKLYNVAGVLYWSGGAISGASSIASLNGLTGATQTFAAGSSGTDFSISSVGSTHTFNIPSTSSTTRGLLTAADWMVFNNKVNGTVQITAGTGLAGGGDLTTNRTLSLDINGLGATSAVSASNTIAIYDGVSVKKIARSDFLQGLTSALTYQGTWNANTNTPALSDGSGTGGYVYVANTASTTVNLGSGALTINSGDFLIYNASTSRWQVAPSGSSVASVFGRTGNITASTGDYNTDHITETATATNKFFTDARARNSIATNVLGLSYATSTGVLSLAGGYTIPLTASTSAWQQFYDTPSNRITAGSGLSWTANTIAVNTSALTLASLTQTGIVSTTTQSFAGNKTFTGSTALATTTVGVGGLTVSGASVFATSTATAFSVNTLSIGSLGGILFGTAGSVGTTSLSALTTNSLTSSANVVTSSVNGVISTTTAVNTNTISTTTNTFATLVNGVSSVFTKFINSLGLSISGNVLTSTVNGVTATSSVISSNTLGYASSTGLLTSTVNGVVSTSTLSVPTTNALTSSGNIVTSNVNGVTSTTTAVNSVTNTSSGNVLTSGANGVTATTTLVNSVALSTTTNTFAALVNGVTSAFTNLINSLAVSLSGNVITVTANGVSATSSVISSNTVSSNGNTITSNVNGVTSTTTAVNTNTLGFATSTGLITSTVNGVVATSSISLSGLTTNDLAGTANTITSIVNGVASSTSIIRSLAISTSTNSLTVNINGLASSTNFINTLASALSGNILTTTVNGVSATSSVISANTLGYSTVTGLFTSTINGVVATSTITPVTAGDTIGQSSFWNGTAWAPTSTLFFKDGKVGINTLNPTESLHVQGNAFISGNLTALGTTTTVDVANLSVASKNIFLASSTSPTDALADGGGIILKGTTDKSILWVNSTDKWTFSDGIEVASTSAGSVFKGALSLSALGGGILQTNSSGVVSTTSLASLTTNALTSSGNVVTSNVNGITSTTTSVNSVTNTSSGNVLTSGTNGVTATTTLVNNVTLSTTTNTFATLVNGITSAFTNIINSLTTSLSGNVLTTTVNGVSATSSVISGNTVSSSGNTITSNVNGVTSTTTAVNANVLGISGSVITSTVNGITASSSLATSSLAISGTTFLSVTGGGYFGPGLTLSVGTGDITLPNNSEVIITGGAGAVLGGGVAITIPEANSTTRGLVSTGVQNFSGLKNFLSGISVTGTTSITGLLDMNSNRITNVASPVGTNDAANKAYVDALTGGVVQQSPVIARASSTAPVSPATGDRYILLSGASGFGSCTTNQIAQWSGSAWVCNNATIAGTGSPTNGWTVNVTSEGTNYSWNGSAWTASGSTVSHLALLNLQGGTSGEYYHVNQNDYNALTAGTAQLTALQTGGSPTFANLTLTGNTTFGGKTYTWPASYTSGQVLSVASTSGQLQWINALTSSLSSGSIFVGNGANAAAAVALSGDATLANTGVLTLASSGVAANTYGSSTSIPFFTVDSKGRLTNAGVNALTHGLSSSGNIITSNVNGVSATSSIINSNTLSLSGITLTSTINGVATTTTLAFASSTADGLISTTTQTFAGNKTFSGTTSLATTTANNLTIGTLGGILFGTAGSVGTVATSSLGLLTTNVAEGTNLYYTNARARNSLSSSALGLDYATSTGTFTLTSGYVIPLTASSTNWNNFYNTPSSRITAGTGLAWAGNTLSVTSTSVVFASTTADGIVSTTTQSFAGNKAFTGSTALATTTASGAVTLASTLNLSALAGGLLVTNGSGLVSTTSVDSLGGFFNNGNAFGGLATLGTTDANSLRFIASSTEAIRILANGNIGIGNTNPTYKLDIAGDMNISAGSVQRMNGVVFAQASTASNNYFTGGSGNLTMTGINNTANGYQSLQANTTGSYNTANGTWSLYSNINGVGNTANGSASLYSNTSGTYNTAYGADSLGSNTTGIRNTASGYQSLYSNTNGSRNVAIGYQSLLSNTIGNQNTASGYQSLYSNTTASGNTAYGNGSLFSNTTGTQNTANGHNALALNTTTSSNTALGYDSGRYIADTASSNATSSNSLYLGAFTKALASGDTNEIVIGYDAIGNGSNSVTLGNTSITTTILRGNVGIGTTAPTNKLHVEGAITIGSTTPATTANALYNNAGLLYWNGIQLGQNVVASYWRGTPGTVGATSVIPLTATANYGSDITLASNQLTLKAGKTYRLQAAISNNGSAASTYYWRQAGGSQIGSAGVFDSDTAAGASDSSAEVVITPSTDMQVELYNNCGCTLTVSAGWVFAEVIAGNAAVTGQSVDYLRVTRATSNQIGVVTNSDVIFNNVQAGNIPFNTTTGVATLSAGKTYRISVGLSVMGGTTTYAQFAIVNAATNVVISNHIEHLSNNENTTNTSDPTLDYIYTPSADTTIKLRTTAVGAGSMTIRADIQSHMTITQLGTSAITGDSMVAVGGNTLSGTGGALSIGTLNSNVLALVTNNVTKMTLGTTTSNYLRLNGYGAGTLTTDASGNVTAASDARLKTDYSSFERGLDAILGLTPTSYKWTDGSGLETEHTYAGFVAQNVQDFVPEAVGMAEDGTLTLSDRPILAALVNAAKELNQKSEVNSLQIQKLGEIVGLSADDLNKIKIDYLAGKADQTDARFAELKGQWDTLRADYEEQELHLAELASTTVALAVNVASVASSTDALSNVGIGTNAPARKLHVQTSLDEAPVRFQDATGYCEINPTTTTWSCTSDQSLKTNVMTIDDSLEGVLGLNPVNFDWKTQTTSTEGMRGSRFGLIAQEVEKLFPHLVDTDETTGLKSVAYGGLSILLVKAMQEQYGGLTGTVFSSTTLDDLLASTSSLATLDDEGYEYESIITNPFAYILERVEAGIKVARTLVAEKMIAVEASFKRIFANELCLTNNAGKLVCVDGDSLEALDNHTIVDTTEAGEEVINANQAPDNTPATSDSTGSRQATITITINGESTAEVETGATYTDEGAEATDSATTTPVVIRTYQLIDGALVEQSVNIDTATTSTHQVTYRVLAEDGTTVLAEATRTVNVVEAAGTAGGGGDSGSDDGQGSSDAVQPPTVHRPTSS